MPPLLLLRLRGTYRLDRSCAVFDIIVFHTKLEINRVTTLNANITISNIKIIDKVADSVVVGHSAGGHLALLAGGEIDQLKGVIALAPITNIKAYARGDNSCQKVTQDFMQGMPTDKPKAYTQANPSEQPLHPQSIILQGDQDAIVPAFNLEQLKRPVVMLEGVGHFDWIHPGSAAFNTLIQNLNEM